MTRELLFVTNNAHKLAEVKAIAGESLILKNLNDIGCYDKIAETGSTFSENASIKSAYIYERYGLNCFADDSGLEADALQGEPGIFSARYSAAGDDQSNLALLIHRMRSATNRKARFRCVISLILKGEETFFEGLVEGTILNESAGHAGFGYDPVFLPNGYTQTFAEMPADQKNHISHRGQAVRKMLRFLNRKKSFF